MCTTWPASSSRMLPLWRSLSCNIYEIMLYPAMLSTNRCCAEMHSALPFPYLEWKYPRRVVFGASLYRKKCAQNVINSGEQTINAKGIVGCLLFTTWRLSASGTTSMNAVWELVTRTSYGCNRTGRPDAWNMSSNCRMSCIANSSWHGL